MIKIKTYLRLATFKDIFDRDGSGSILENKQIYYKESDGFIRGPYRLVEPIETESYYKNLVLLLSTERVYLIDSFEYKKSITVELPLQKPETFDLLQADELIPRTIYYLKKGDVIDGPFYVNDKTSKKDLRNKSAGKAMYVLANPQIIKEVKNFVSEAV